MKLFHGEGKYVRVSFCGSIPDMVQHWWQKSCINIPSDTFIEISFLSFC